jgi:hypothetical protein
MKLLRSPDFWIESGASVLTLAGIYLGSTTVPGGLCYLASLVFWFWATFRKSLWGLMPLNVATVVVVGVNLWRAW